MELDQWRLINRARVRGGGGTAVNVGILLAAQGRTTDISSGRMSGVVESRGSGAGRWCCSCSQCGTWWQCDNRRL